MHIASAKVGCGEKFIMGNVWTEFFSDIDVILLNTKSMDVKNALGDLILGQRELNFESKGVLKRLGINIENMDKMAAALGNVNNNGYKNGPMTQILYLFHNQKCMSKLNS